MTTEPKKWQAQRFVYRPLKNHPQVLAREVRNVRFLKKGPFKVSYGEFTYSVQPVISEDEKVSYIAARMITPNGRVLVPVHEYELSRRFPTVEAAEEAWSGGFECREDLFLSREIVSRLIDEGAAELIPTTDVFLPRAGPA